MIKKLLDKVLHEVATSAQTGQQTSMAKYLWLGMGIIIGAALLRGFFMYLMRQRIIVMSRKIEYDQKNEMYAHFQKLSQAFYRRNNTGDLMARISEDVGRVRMYVGPAIMYSINLISLIILVVTIMLMINAKLTLLVLLPLPVLALSIYFVNSTINRRSTRIQAQLSRITTFTQEVFSGIRVIKSFASEDSIKRQFSEETETYQKHTLSMARVDSLFFPLMFLLIGSSILITLYAGGMGVINHQLTFGELAQFFIYVNMLSWPVTSIGWVASMVQRAAASQVRIDEFLNEQPEIFDELNATNLQVKGSIEFQHVSLKYPNTGITALRDVSFKIKEGESLGIIGRTGSGKTTLAQLLLRNYDVTEGTILVDGMALQTLSLGGFRRQIGFVPQDDFLFSDTIANNIMFGSNINIPPIELHTKMLHAATVAGLMVEIEEFPNGFETLIGERGITLSGGQKQRVAIARAIMNNPKILVLDDCFSAIDTNTEAQILQHLGEEMKGKTSLIISHRVSTVKNANHIIVLDKGEIAEQGTHDSLLKMNGYYLKLYNKQLKEKERERESEFGNVVI